MCVCVCECVKSIVASSRVIAMIVVRCLFVTCGSNFTELYSSVPGRTSSTCAGIPVSAPPTTWNPNPPFRLFMCKLTPSFALAVGCG